MRGKHPRKVDALRAQLLKDEGGRREYAEQRAWLQTELQRGLDSGRPRSLDIEAVIREARSRKRKRGA